MGPVSDPSNSLSVCTNTCELKKQSPTLYFLTEATQPLSWCFSKLFNLSLMPDILFVGTRLLFTVLMREDTKGGNDPVKEDKWLSSNTKV